MKRIISILMLFVHLFNIGGQLAFHQYLVYRSDKLFNDQISKNRYNIDDLTEIRIPVNMPGIHDWTSYENLTGRIQFENSAYNYVKIRMTRNAIFLVCIPNYETTRLADQNIIYARQIPDIPVPKKDHVPFGKVNLVTYDYLVVLYNFLTLPATAVKFFCSNQAKKSNFHIKGPAQPPDSLNIFS